MRFCLIFFIVLGIERRTEPTGEGGGGQTKISAEILSRGRFPLVLQNKTSRNGMFFLSSNGGIELGIFIVQKHFSVYRKNIVVCNNQWVYFNFFYFG